MESYKTLSKYPVFSIDTLLMFYDHQKSAYSMLYRLLKKGMIKKIRQNLYSPINLSSGQVVATKYQIACAINKTCYISHHSAFEYYGYANQVFNEMVVSSEQKFNAFEFDHIAYKYMSSKLNIGIVDATNTTNVRITDLERTVIDSIKDVNKIAGLEECLNSLQMISYLDESKLILYLDTYHIQGLYQRVGYILERYQQEMHLSQAFIQYCKHKMGKSTRYLVSESETHGYYHNEWHIVVPKTSLDDLEVRDETNAQV